MTKEKTFADKKVEEFRDVLEEYDKTICKSRAFTNIENWLRKTIAEAERGIINKVIENIKFCNTQAQAYNICERIKKELSGGEGK
jgi:hypothetical protein